MEKFDIYLKQNKESDRMVYYTTVEAESEEQAQQIAVDNGAPEYYDDIFRKKRRRFNKCGSLVASSNIIRVSLIRRFDIIVRYSENNICISHSKTIFNDKPSVSL